MDFYTKLVCRRPQKLALFHLFLVSRTPFLDLLLDSQLGVVVKTADSILVSRV